MPSTPENKFIASIHRHIPQVYKEKMHNTYRGGTPDVYYSGNLGDIWVEYKYLSRLPKQVLPNLSALQQVWLNSRHAEGRNVMVIVGWADGGVILTNREWMVPMDKEVFIARSLHRKEVATFILSKTGVQHDVCPSDLFIGEPS